MQEQEFTVFYRANVGNLYRYFYNRCFSKSLSEDLTADTFLTFIEMIKSKGSEIELPQNFLFGIAKNVFRDHLKEKYKNPVLEISDELIENYSDSEFGDDVSDYVTLEERLSKVLEFLPQAQRKVLALRFLEKLSLSEICDRLGKDMNYVKTTQRRGLRSLEKLMGVHQSTLNN